MSVIIIKTYSNDFFNSGNVEKNQIVCARGCHGQAQFSPLHFDKLGAYFFLRLGHREQHYDV